MGARIGPPVTPDIIKKLLIANVAIFILQQILKTSSLAGYEISFMVVPVLFWTKGFIWQPFTYMFMHGDFMHIAGNMFVLWMFGSELVFAWGSKKFLKYFLTCGVGAGIIIASYPYVFRAVGIDAYTGFRTLGASGATMGVLLAYALTWPNRTIMLIFPPIPLKAIYLIPLLFLLEFTTGPSNVSHAGHLGGVFIGLIWMWKLGPKGTLPTWRQIKYRWERHKMRKRLRDANRDQFRDDDGPRRWH